MMPTLPRRREGGGAPEPRVVAGLSDCCSRTSRRRRARRSAQAFAIYGQLPSYRAMLDREGAAGPADSPSPAMTHTCGARWRACATSG